MAAPVRHETHRNPVSWWVVAIVLALIAYGGWQTWEAQDTKANLDQCEFYAELQSWGEP